MDRTEAMTLLGLTGEASARLVQVAFEEKYAALQAWIDSAPTAQLRAATVASLEELEQARAVALEGARPGSDTIDTRVGPKDATIDLGSGSAPAVRGPDPFEGLVGRVLQGFRIERKLGQGGMGAVFLATQLDLERHVAIKVLPPAMTRDQNRIERFKREARTLASLDSGSFVPIHAIFRDGGLLCIVMGFVPGGSVKDRIEQEERLFEEEVARIARQTGLGLYKAWQKGIVHRDIKPDNLLLAEDGSVRIADFGLARGADESKVLTLSGWLMGTPAYMSPEQWDDGRKEDHRSDLYSLGCVMYEMLTGEKPFPGPTVPKFMRQHLMGEVPYIRAQRPDLSPPMAALVTRLLQKDPAARIQDGQELCAALDALRGRRRTGRLAPADMTENERRAYIQALATMLSADRFAERRELELMSRLGRELRCKLRKEDIRPYPLGPIADRIDRPSVRAMLFTDLVRMAKVDGKLDGREQRLLKYFARRWRLSLPAIEGLDWERVREAEEEPG